MDPNLEAFIMPHWKGGYRSLNTLTEQEVDDLLNNPKFNDGGTAYRAVVKKKEQLNQSKIDAQERQKSEQEALRREGEEKRLSDFNLSVQEEAQKRSGAELAKRLDEIFGKVETAGVERIDRQFIPARRKLVAEEAALGRLRSPISIESVGRLDEQRNMALSQLIGNIASQRASGELDVSKTIEGLLSGERDAERRGREFQQDLGFRKQGLSDQIRLARDKLSQDRELTYAGFGANRDKDADDDGTDIELGFGPLKVKKKLKGF